MGYEKISMKQIKAITTIKTDKLSRMLLVSACVRHPATSGELFPKPPSMRPIMQGDRLSSGVSKCHRYHIYNIAKASLDGSSPTSVFWAPSHALSHRPRKRGEVGGAAREWRYYHIQITWKGAMASGQDSRGTRPFLTAGACLPTTHCGAGGLWPTTVDRHWSAAKKPPAVAYNSRVSYRDTQLYAAKTIMDWE